MDILDKLNSEFGLNGILQFVIRDELIFIEGKNKFANFAVSLHGAHVTSFQPIGKEDILWVSEESNYNKLSPIRGGIPICWPWFGDHPEDDKKPSHGFARLAEWEIVEVTILEDNETVSITLELNSSCETRKLWPHDFKLQNKITFGQALGVELTTFNTGDNPFTITSALHSYFNICEIRNISIDGLKERYYIDSMDNDSTKQQNGAITFNEEVDRVYIDTEDTCTITDPGYNRTVNISKRGSQTTVVWNPWIAKSERMADFGNEEYQEMVCVETTNALEDQDQRCVESGEKHSLIALIW